MRIVRQAFKGGKAHFIGPSVMCQWDAIAVNPRWEATGVN
jgi:hypothetical protein